MLDHELISFLRGLCLAGALLSYVGLVHALSRSVGIFSDTEE